MSDRPKGLGTRAHRGRLLGAMAAGVVALLSALVAVPLVAAEPPTTIGSAGPMLGVVPARGAAHASTSPDMTWHGGAVLTQATTAAIFWGTSWGSYSGDKIAGIDSLYQGVGGTSYMNTNTEYTGVNGQVTTNVSYLGHTIDTSAAPKHAPRTSAILAEVAKMIPASELTPNGYYMVYSDQARGHAGYCAWHSYGTINGVNVQFGFAFNLDGDAGCDPQDTWTSHSQGLAAIGNVTGHELSETVTDPRNGGWYDSSGAENADKCAWTFQSAVKFANGTSWKIQGNWSNAAYDTGTGYPNSSGQNGCLQTK